MQPSQNSGHSFQTLSPLLEKGDKRVWPARLSTGSVVWLTTMWWRQTSDFVFFNFFHKCFTDILSRKKQCFVVYFVAIKTFILLLIYR